MQTNPYSNFGFNQQQGYVPQQYGYNPYVMQQRFQPQPQMEQQQYQPQMQRGINGKVVQSVEMITANDVPMDGSVAFFPMQDMSAILAKSWNADGTIKTTVYKPFTEPLENNMVNNTIDTENIKLGLSDEVTEVFIGKFNELSERLGQIEQVLSKPAAKSTAKKEG